MAKEIKSIALIYFSATDVTRTYARVMCEHLLSSGCTVKCYDVTAYQARQIILPIEDFDAFIFGFPVFADFAPSVINEWLPTLNGRGKPCVQFFTYGARSTGHAHFHTHLLLEQAGFKVLCSAEFLGRHTYNIAGWHVLPDRPNEVDFLVARSYVELALEKFSMDTPKQLVLQKPFGYNRAMDVLQQAIAPTERGWTNPVRVQESCGMCRLCEEECPTQAFNADTGLSDPALCIKCMRCVYVCPEHVLAVDPRMEGVYANFLADWHLTDAIMNGKQSRIITEPWQTAA